MPKFPVYNPKLHAKTNQTNKNLGISHKFPRVKTVFSVKKTQNIGIIKDFKSEIKVNTLEMSGKKKEVLNKGIETI